MFILGIMKGCLRYKVSENRFFRKNTLNFKLGIKELCEINEKELKF